MRPTETIRLAFPATISESWDRYIGAARFLAASPLAGDAAYPAFEEAQRRAFDSRAQAGILTVRYRTEIRIGKPAVALVPASEEDYEVRQTR